MTYLGTVACVQEAYIAMLDPKSHPYVMHCDEGRSQAQAEIQSIASKSIEIAEYLKRLDLVQYLPQSVVTAFLYVNFVHLRHKTAIDNFNGIFQSIRVVEAMKDCYFDVQYGVNLVSNLLRREVQLDMNLLSDSRSQSTMTSKCDSFKLSLHSLFTH